MNRPARTFAYLLLLIPFLLTGCVAATHSEPLAQSIDFETVSEPSHAHIALLVPLHGPFASQGEAIRDGFMTAYFNAKPTGMTVKIYDTGQSDDIGTLYTEAIQEGTQLIVGPVSKANVEKLVQNTSLSVPTLALNYLPNDVSAPQNLIQFGLSPNQEATQLALYMHKRNIQRVLILSPDNDWGHEVTQTFANTWQQLGGQIAVQVAFDQHNLAETIKNALLIDQSEDRIQSIVKILNKKIRAIPYRRKDIDGIFLLATPAQSRQILPLLNYYFAGNVPTFSISTAYTGIPAPSKNNDLNRLYITDMPWVISPDPEIVTLRNKIKTLWPSAYRKNNRLYAVGMDAFLISQHLPQLIMTPDAALNGLTGQLTINDQQQIVRTLSIAQFRKGIARKI
ncbi:MAG: penicillin-binding protein activator [Gammaproteobacteria bacterium]|nr:penicillin-binding protein activator [Gammaproteobacteria bacterium]